MNIKFVADSSCDIRKIPGVDFTTVPLTISTDEREFVDDENLDTSAMMTYLAEYKGRSYTACPSTEKWLQAFEGGEEIYALTLTSGLSGTFNSAKVAADIYLSEHPDVKICVFDSLSTGAELRLHVEKVVELKKKGCSFEEVCEKTKEYMLTTRLFFAFKSLHNLAQNGRVSKLAASAIGMLNISILGTASEEGTIETIGKCRGDKSALKDLVKEMEKAGYQGGKLRITHADNELLAKKLARTMKDEYPEADIIVTAMRGLTCFYGERGGLILGCECGKE